MGRKPNTTKAQKNDFLRSLIMEFPDENTSVAADGEASAEFSGWVDTGSYSLNALLSGSMYGGIADNKSTAFAGESATGKTFFVLGIVKAFQEKYPDGIVIYYDTEAAVTKDMMEGRGIDTKRLVISEPETIQKFRHHALKMLDAYISKPESKRPKMMFVLDSLGMLSSTKEIADTEKGSETKDMTKPGIIKAAFRVLTLKMARAKVPLLVTNHVYAAIGSLFPSNEMSGGSGLKYAASTIAMLGKSKDKDGAEVIGSLIKVKMYKSRLSKENQVATVRLSYKSGLDRYYGLGDLAIQAGIWGKVGKREGSKPEDPNAPKKATKFVINDVQVASKTVYENPEKYFTPEVMERLEKFVNKKYSYGEDGSSDEELDEELDEVFEEEVKTKVKAKRKVVAKKKRA
jgi:RecA/RadA recombinase